MNGEKVEGVYVALTNIVEDEATFGDNAPVFATTERADTELVHP
jgi:hypothetical protein